MPRYASRVDIAHNPIREALEKMGCSVLSLAPLGKGVPDLLASMGCVSVLIEVKTPKHGTKPETAKRQEEFRAGWGGWSTVARGLEDVESIVAQMRSIHRRTA